MFKLLRLLTLVLLAVLSLQTPAEELQIEVIEPRYRLAEDLLPALEPLVGVGGSITAFQGRLVIKAKPSSLDQILEVLDRLDEPPRQLMVLLTQNADLVRRERSFGVEGSIEAGDVELGFPANSTSRPGFTVGDPNARFGAEDSGSTTRRSDVQRVKVLDGREAVIHIGQSVPVVTTGVTYDGLPRELVEYRHVLVGFVVQPRVTGNRVTLQIHPRQDVLSERPGVINVQHIDTTVSGPLGEWLSIGEVSQEQSGKSRGLASSQSLAESDRRGVWLKVEEVEE